MVIGTMGMEKRIMSKMLKVEVAKSLPFSKERNINRVGDLIHKLRESGKMKGFLPSTTDRVSTFKIDYAKTQKIDFRKVLAEVLGEKEGFSLPLVTRLISWSSEDETKTALESQSVLAFPYDQLEGIITTVVEEASKTNYKGRMECDGNMVVIPENERYSQHLIIPVLKYLMTNRKLPSSYLARMGQVSTKNFEVIPEEERESIRKRVPEFPDMLLGEMAGNKNFMVTPISLEFIGKKISKPLKSDVNFQQQLISANQNFINLFGLDVDILDSSKVKEMFIQHGIEDGAYAVAPKHLTPEFITAICEAHRRNITDRKNRRHIDQTTKEFSEDKYNANLQKMEEAIEKYETWASNRHNGAGYVQTEKASYDGMDYDEWLKQREAELEAEESRKKAEAENVADNEDLPDF